MNCRPVPSAAQAMQAPAPGLGQHRGCGPLAVASAGLR